MKRKTSRSVWDAIEDTRQAAASQRAKSTLMMELAGFIEKCGMSPVVKLSKPKTLPTKGSSKQKTALAA